ncbi:MAG: FitA-like ribbon-helix-helix domain-containing protein [Bradyrhizobium sp.]
MREFSCTAFFEPAEENGYVVSFPAIPGLSTQAETIAEASAMAADCLRANLESLDKDDEPAPYEAAELPLTERVNVALATGSPNCRSSRRIGSSAPFCVHHTMSRKNRCRVFGLIGPTVADHVHHAGDACYQMLALHWSGPAMPSLLIRNVDDALHTRLKARAAERRHSLEEEVRELLRIAVARQEMPREHLVDVARRFFGPEQGFELDIPPRRKAREREPPAFSGPEYDR